MNNKENQMGINHTYLVQPGKWATIGTYTDHEGNVYPVTGEASISHDGGIWYNRTSMTLQTTPANEVECVYEIIPMQQGADATSWTAETLPLGRISGTFAIVDDTILSSAKTEEGTNMESLRKVNDDHYENRGALFIQSIKVASWQLTLKRMP